MSFSGNLFAWKFAEEGRCLVIRFTMRVTGNDPKASDYIMVEAMAKCPQCRRPVNEKTLVEVQ
jgi:hypothetical protein